MAPSGQPSCGSIAIRLHVDVTDAVPPPSVEILGIPLAITDYKRTMDWMDATIVDGGQGYACVAATHTVMACQEDHELRTAVVNRSVVAGRTGD